MSNNANPPALSSRSSDTAIKRANMSALYAFLGEDGPSAAGRPESKASLVARALARRDELAKQEHADYVAARFAELGLNRDGTPVGPAPVPAEPTAEDIRAARERIDASEGEDYAAPSAPAEAVATLLDSGAEVFDEDADISDDLAARYPSFRAARTVARCRAIERIRLARAEGDSPPAPLVSESVPNAAEDVVLGRAPVDLYALYGRAPVDVYTVYRTDAGEYRVTTLLLADGRRYVYRVSPDGYARHGRYFVAGERDAASNYADGLRPVGSVVVASERDLAPVLPAPRPLPAFDPATLSDATLTALAGEVQTTESVSRYLAAAGYAPLPVGTFCLSVLAEIERRADARNAVPTYPEPVPAAPVYRVVGPDGRTQATFSPSPEAAPKTLATASEDAGKGSGRLAPSGGRTDAYTNEKRPLSYAEATARSYADNLRAAERIFDSVREGQGRLAGPSDPAGIGANGRIYAVVSDGAPRGTKRPYGTPEPITPPPARPATVSRVGTPPAPVGDAALAAALLSPPKNPDPSRGAAAEGHRRAKERLHLFPNYTEALSDALREVYAEREGRAKSPRKPKPTPVLSGASGEYTGYSADGLDDIPPTSANGRDYPPRETPRPATVPCPRCLGAGRIDAYRHVENGVCFECNGAGRVYGPDIATPPPARPVPAKPAPVPAAPARNKPDSGERYYVRDGECVRLSYSRGADGSFRVRSEGGGTTFVDESLANRAAAEAVYGREHDALIAEGFTPVAPVKIRP